MKKTTLYISFLLLITLFSSCEKVVDIDLNNAEPKLVIDAIIKWQKGTSGENQTIKLSLTNDFYTNDILPASGAVVKVINSGGTEFDFLETVPNSGEYICTNFVPVIDETYTLAIQYDSQIYRASSKLFATPEIINITQTRFLIFDKEVYHIENLCLIGINKIETIKFDDKHTEFLIYHNGENDSENPYKYQMERKNGW